MVSKDIPQTAHAAADNSTGFHLVDALVSVEFDSGNNPVQHLLQGVYHVVVDHDVAVVYHQLPETRTVVVVVDSFVVVDCIAADADPVVGIADVVDVVVVDGSAVHRRVFSEGAERSDSSTPWRR